MRAELSIVNMRTEYIKGKPSCKKNSLHKKSKKNSNYKQYP